MSQGNAHDYVQDTSVDPRPLVGKVHKTNGSRIYTIVAQILDIVRGLFYLHNHVLGPIIHGDLKGASPLSR